MIGGRGGLAYLVRPDDVISGQPLMALDFTGRINRNDQDQSGIFKE